MEVHVLFHALQYHVLLIISSALGPLIQMAVLHLTFAIQ